MQEHANELKLKPISADAVPNAIEKAERYRLLNDPEQAESICLDVQSLQPGNQRNLVILILAICDQFGSRRGARGKRQALEFVEHLSSEYERLYYQGIIREREGRACLMRTHGEEAAYDCFRSAMECYSAAEVKSPPRNDDAKLRYNACVRVIGREGLVPAAPVSQLPLE